MLHGLPATAISKRLRLSKSNTVTWWDKKRAPVFAVHSLRVALDTYCHYILTFLKRNLSPGDLVVFNYVLKLVGLAHANEDCLAAVPATVEECGVISRAADCDEKQATLAMRYTGMRLADLRRLRRKQIYLTPKQIQVEVRVTKNRRKRKFRRILRIPCNQVWGKRGDCPPCLINFLKGGQPDDLPFSGVTVAKLNRFIKCHTPKLSSYSFRELFITDICCCVAVCV